MNKVYNTQEDMARGFEIFLLCSVTIDVRPEAKNRKSD